MEFNGWVVKLLKWGVIMSLWVNGWSWLLLLIKEEKWVWWILFLCCNKYLIGFNSEVFGGLFGGIRKVVCWEISWVE